MKKKSSPEALAYLDEHADVLEGLREKVRVESEARYNPLGTEGLLKFNMDSLDPLEWTLTIRMFSHIELMPEPRAEPSKSFVSTQRAMIQ